MCTLLQSKLPMEKTVLWPLLEFTRSGHTIANSGSPMATMIHKDSDMLSITFSVLATGLLASAAVWPLFMNSKK